MDPEDALLASVLRRFLTLAETNARRLHHRNAKALRLTIVQSERQATAEAAVQAKALRLAQE